MAYNHAWGICGYSIFSQSFQYSSHYVFNYVQINILIDVLTKIQESKSNVKVKIF